MNEPKNVEDVIALLRSQVNYTYEMTYRLWIKRF